MKEQIRAFVAVELPNAIKEQVKALETQLMKARADIRWVRTENIHITLKFLGDITPDRLEEVRAGVHEATEAMASFQMTLGSVGAFPNLDRPRVFWVDVEDGRAALVNLQNAVESALCSRHFVREERPFSPHLTIGRVRSPKGLNSLSALIRDIPFQTSDFPVDRVSILQSDLQPAGPVYTVLEHTALP